MPHNPQTTALQVLLLSNYAPDKQYSMSRFAEQLCEGLEAEGLQVEIYCPPTMLGRIGAKPSGLGKWIGYIDKYILFPFYLKAKLKRIPSNCVVHICDHSNSVYTKWLQNTPHLVTCHDLLAVRSALGEIAGNQPKWTGCRLQAMILRGLKRSRAIVSVSKATAQDVKRLVGDRAEWQYDIPNSLNSRFITQASLQQNAVAQEPPSTINLPKNSSYVMHIGGDTWYKNRKAVLNIFAELAQRDPSLQLVFVGAPFDPCILEETACTALSERIHYLSNISDEQLIDLYSASSLLLFPSLIEGFGWPILEAQACGCPVLTFKIEPMSSLNANDELTVDSMQEMAEAAWQHFTLSPEAKAERSERIRSFAAQFTNQASAKAYIALYQKLLQSTDPA